MRHLIPFRYIVGVAIIGAVVILFGCNLISSQKETKRISEVERSKIEAWIEKNNLNRYGDPKDTVYTGGTPLFNEKTGKRINRYEYILRKHPDRPWLK